MERPLSIKEFVPLLGGDASLHTTRARALGRIATGLHNEPSRDDVTHLFKTGFRAGQHSTAVRLYDRDAICWAALFFYCTDILGLEEEVAKTDATPRVEDLHKAFDGIQRGERWTVVIAHEYYGDLKDREIHAAVYREGEPPKWILDDNEDVFLGSTHPDAIVSQTFIPLHKIVAPVLRKLGLMDKEARA